MKQQAIVKRLMKLRESEIKFDLKEGARFKEVFNHPDYLGLDQATQLEFGLHWARRLYQQEVDNPAIDNYFIDFDLSKYTKGSVMLDIGCYLGGKTVRWLEKYKAAEIYGVDIDPRFIQIAKNFAIEKKANAYFKVNFAENLEFPDSYFDVILTEQTLEHVKDIKKVMQECYRVLKQHGLMVVIFPSFWGPTSHHLDHVTRTPLIHWFFKFPILLEAYYSIMDERGDKARWYRRQDRHPLPFEKGFYINGIDATRFSNLIKGNWQIISDGFRQKRNKNKDIILRAVENSIKALPLPFMRAFFSIGYILQKR